MTTTSAFDGNKGVVTSDMQVKVPSALILSFFREGRRDSLKGIGLFHQ